MSEQNEREEFESFDVWFQSQQGIAYDGMYMFAKAAWQYQQQRIDELERDRDEWKDATISANRRFEIAEQLNFEQKAHINELHKALNLMVTFFGMDEDESNKEIFSVANKALQATPAQSLARHDDEVIERCAKVADAWEDIHASTKIRQLKGTL